MSPITELGLKNWQHQGNRKKEGLLPREIGKFRTKHPKDWDGVIPWNSGEPSYFDAAVCREDFIERSVSHIFVIHKLYSAESYVTKNAFPP